MKHLTKSLGVLAAGIPAVAIGGLPAGAAQASSVSGDTAVAVAPASGATMVPNSNITNTLRFNPGDLSVKYSTPTGNGSCGGPHGAALSFTITNRATSTQTVSYRGLRVTMPETTRAGFCVFGSGGGHVTFTLSSSLAKLHITVS